MSKGISTPTVVSCSPSSESGSLLYRPFFKVAKTVLSLPFSQILPPSNLIVASRLLIYPLERKKVFICIVSSFSYIQLKITTHYPYSIPNLYMRISRIDCFFAGPDIEQTTKHYNDPESFRIQPGNIHSYSNQNEHIPQLMPRHHVKKIGKKDRTCQVAGCSPSLSVNISSQNQSDYGLVCRLLCNSLRSPRQLQSDCPGNVQPHPKSAA